MIQRAQTIWLFLAILVMAAIFYFPVYMAPQGSEDLNIGNNYLAIILAGLSILLSLITIFSFKNRKRQTGISLMNILCCVLLLGWLFYSINRYKTKFLSQIGTSGEGYFWIGAFLPIVCILLLLVAILNIRKDEKLVKSMDRLR